MCPIPFRQFSNNKLTALPASAFLNLKLVRQLNLTSNAIADIGSNAFVGMNNLTNLYGLPPA